MDTRARWCRRMCILLTMLLAAGSACHPQPRPVHPDDAHIQLYLDREFVRTVGHDVSREDTQVGFITFDDVMNAQSGDDEDAGDDEFFEDLPRTHHKEPPRTHQSPHHASRHKKHSKEVDTLGEELAEAVIGPIVEPVADAAASAVIYVTVCVPVNIASEIIQQTAGHLGGTDIFVLPAGWPDYSQRVYWGRNRVYIPAALRDREFTLQVYLNGNYTGAVRCVVAPGERRVRLQADRVLPGPEADVPAPDGATPDAGPPEEPPVPEALMPGKARRLLPDEVDDIFEEPAIDRDDGPPAP